MSMKRALQLVLAVSLFGASFSGALSYHEVFGKTAASCPSVGAPGTVFGYPACVYGFFMYVTLVVVSLLGLASERDETT